MTSVPPPDDAAGREPAVTTATGRPLVEPASQVAPPDPLDEVRAIAACLPNDADDGSDAGRPTTDHAATGWRAEPLMKP